MIGLAVLAVRVAAAAVVASAYLFQRQLICLPSGEPPPAEAVLPAAEDVGFTTADGLELAAWYVPALGQGPHPAVVVLPGNAGDRSLRAPLAELLCGMGASVLLVDYRGFGGNPGRPDEAGLHRDARAARDYLLTRDDVDADRLVYFGESLGAAVAVTLAVEHRPAGVVLRSPFTSLTDVGRLHYPFLPVGLLLRDRYPSADVIRDVDAPLLVIAGEDDSIVPASHSRRLYDAANEPKHLVVVGGADHNDRALLDGSEVRAAVRGFLDDFVQSG